MARFPSDARRQLGRFLVLLDEEHVEDDREAGKGCDCTDHIALTREEQAELVDHQRHDIGKAALIADREPSYFSANTDKLTMILIGEAMTLGAVALPLIASNFVKKNYKETAHLISYDFQLFVAFMLPAVLGMTILAAPIYTLFYGSVNSLQLALFIWAVLQSFLLALYTMVAPILQALHYSKVAMRYFIITLVIKLILQVPSIMIFHSYGPLVATTIAFGYGTWIIIRKIHEVTGFRVKSTLKGIIGISIITAIMAVVTLVLYGLISLILMPLSPGHFKALLVIAVAGGGGFFTYIYIAAKAGLLEKLMGSRGTRLRQKLHI